MQLCNQLIVFQTLADFAYIYIHSQNPDQRQLVKTGTDALLMQYVAQDNRFGCSDTEPSDPSDSSDTDTDTTHTTTATHVTDTTATQHFDCMSQHSSQRHSSSQMHSTSQMHSRNGYLYTFA